MYTFADRFMNGVDELVTGFRGWTRSDHTTYFPLASMHNKNTFALYDGSIMSVIRLDGYMGQYFARQHKELVGDWSKFLNTFAKDRSSSGFGVYWTYEYDPDGMKENAAKYRHGMIEAAKRRGMDVTDLVEEEAELYGNICATQAQLLLLITNVNALPQAARKEATAEARKRRAPFRKGDDSTLYGMAIPALEAIHEQQVTKFEHHLKSAGRNRGYAYKRLDVREATYEMRRMFDPSTTGPGWKARLTPGEVTTRAVDGVRMSNQRRQEKVELPLDYSMVLPPKLSRQMISDNVTDLGRYTVVGDRIYAPLFVRELANSPEPLENLIRHCYNARLPIRINFYLSSDGANANYVNRLLASIFTNFSQSNKQINKADRAMQAYSDANGFPYAYGLAVTTWSTLECSYDEQGAALYNTRKIQKRVRDLEAYMQSWGSQQLESFFGCCVEATMSSSPGYMHPTGTPLAPQIESDIAMQLPITRSANLWKPDIAMWFRTQDGVLAPYRPFSNEQSTMITLVTGGMGYGKSNVISGHIEFFATHPEAVETPYIRGIDFGASSSGVMDMLAAQLPPERRHEVVFNTFVDDGSMVKNMMDTRLGCRYPLTDHRAFLADFLFIVCNSLAEHCGPGDLRAVFFAMIDRAYAMYDDNALEYVDRSFHMVDAAKEVQQALTTYEMAMDANTSHWEVVDFLVEQALARGGDPELIYAARVAQRSSVPIMADLIQVASLLRDQFTDMPMIHGKPLMDAIARQLMNANETFKCFNGRTTIDVSESRATVFDVSEAFGRGSTDMALWQRGVYFAVVMRLLTEDLFINLLLSGEEFRNRQEVLQISDELLAWHLKYLERQDQSMKVFWADEVHRIDGIEGSARLLDSMALEARKYVVGLLLGTQRAESFTPTLREEATTYLMFGASQSPVTAKKIQDTFGLEDDERDALLAITPPSAQKGAMLLAMFKTKTGGLQKQILHYQMGGLKRWAYATEGDERALRRLMYQAAPSTQVARRILARHCPDLKSTLAELGHQNPGMSQEDLIHKIANDLIAIMRAA